MKVNKVRLGIFLSLAIIIIVAIICMVSKKYNLIIKDVENITSVISQKNTSEGKIEVTSETLVKEITDAITNERKTKVKSENNVPDNDEYYILTFNGTNQKIYVYVKNEKYYIEESYNGIYEITQEEYDKIMRYLTF